MAHQNGAEFDRGVERWLGANAGCAIDLGGE